MNDLRHGLSFVGHHPHLIVHLALNQIGIALAALAISLVVAVPLGVWLGHIHRGSFIAINISNVGRALPSLAIIALLIGAIGFGNGPLIFALVILAAPLILTNAYVAVDGVDPDIVDAARGMGMREREVLLRAELPLALPLLFAGIRTAAVYVVATVPLGAVAGATGGLGDVIANQASYRLSGVIGAAICVALLALLVDAAFAALQRAVTPRGLRPQVDHAALREPVPPPQPIGSLT